MQGIRVTSFLSFRESLPIASGIRIIALHMHAGKSGEGSLLEIFSPPPPVSAYVTNPNPNFLM